MIALLVFGVGIPGVVFGLAFGSTADLHLAGVALALAVLGCVVRDLRVNWVVTRRPRP